MERGVGYCVRACPKISGNKIDDMTARDYWCGEFVPGKP
jgi:hypothetical protein